MLLPASIINVRALVDLIADVAAVAWHAVVVVITAASVVIVTFAAHPVAARFDLAILAVCTVVDRWPWFSKSIFTHLVTSVDL